MEHANISGQRAPARGARRSAGSGRRFAPELARAPPEGDPALNVEQFLEDSARKFPAKTAVVSGGRRLTYQELEEQCNRFAHGLAARGVARGDRVIVYLENSIESVIAIFGILKAGGVFVVVNPTTKVEKLVYLINDSGAAALVTQADKLRAIEPCWAQTPALRAVVVAGNGEAPAGVRGKDCARFEELCAHGGPATPPARATIDLDLAALIYTSGSTGTPKGVMLTHLNMVSAATSITTYLENTPDDIILNVLPLSFDYGLYQVLMAAKFGGTVVIERSFSYMHDVLSTLVRERVTGFPVVPTISALLLEVDLSKYDFSRVRYITNTAAALPTAHIARLRRLLPHVRIFSMYGLTECKRVSYLPPEQLDVRPASVGRGMPNEEAYIVDAADARVGPGVVGELVVRGANVARGYWGLPKETAERFRPGPLPGELVLYTGDLFTMDEDGYLYFVGRTDDIIKSRGEKVSPREVENVLCTLATVAEAAVVGIPDDVLGEAIVAVVTPRNSGRPTKESVLKHCRDHLESFMIPSVVDVREALPRTPNGKIDRKLLAQEASFARADSVRG
jgi:long-chain acyl-CoA synthetase